MQSLKEEVQIAVKTMKKNMKSAECLKIFVECLCVPLLLIFPNKSMRSRVPKSKRGNSNWGKKLRNIYTQLNNIIIDTFKIVQWIKLQSK